MEQIVKEFPTFTGQIRSGTTKYGEPASTAINEFMEKWTEENNREIKVVGMHSFDKQFIGGSEKWLMVVFECGLIDMVAVELAQAG